MIFHILTLFPEIFEGYRSASILGSAAQRGLVRLHITDIRDFALDRHRTCDDYTYGGGAGMVLKAEPLAAALRSIPALRDSPPGEGPPVIYLTPSGRLWDQRQAETLAARGEAVLICGRYEGIDQRVIDLYVSEEVSIGEYVLSGGEVAAMAVVDSVVRLVPGVIREQSLAEESFRGGLLEYPQYTRPVEFEGLRVPEVLLSGHHARIQRWRLRKSVEKTLRVRPELLESKELPEQVREVLQELAGEGEPDGQDTSDRGGADQNGPGPIQHR